MLFATFGGRSTLAQDKLAHFFFGSSPARSQGLADQAQFVLEFCKIDQLRYLEGERGNPWQGDSLLQLQLPKGGFEIY